MRGFGEDEGWRMARGGWRSRERRGGRWGGQRGGPPWWDRYDSEYRPPPPHRRRGRRGQVGWPAAGRWRHAIGPERREDYDWAYNAGRPEWYGWTGRTGR